MVLAPLLLLVGILRLGLRTLEYLIKQNADPNAQVLYVLCVNELLHRESSDDYPLVICDIAIEHGH